MLIAIRHLERLLGAPKASPEGTFSGRCCSVLLFSFFSVSWLHFSIFCVQNILLKILVGMGHLGRSDHGEMSSPGASVW